MSIRCTECQKLSAGLVDYCEHCGGELVDDAELAEIKVISSVADLLAEHRKIEAEAAPTIYPPLRPEPDLPDIERLMGMERRKLDDLFAMVEELHAARDAYKSAKHRLCIASGQLHQFWEREKLS
jgi:hypothetical protein